MPFPAGAPSDMVGRAIGQKLAEQLGESVVPDNRTGAGGNLGIAAVAKAPPDGYTLLVTSPTIAISPALYSNLAYDAGRDLTPVARLATIENVLLVHPSVPARTLKEFVALARARPGRLNFGSGGAGTTNHLANELLKSLEKINLVHVPYKGATNATIALIGGEIDEVVVAVAPALPLIQTGKLRPLAVLSERRVPTLPNVPTSKEAGIDNFTISIWYGMVAPAGTPREVIARLNREIVKALESQDLKGRMSASGIDPWPGTAEELGSLLRSETARYAKLIRAAGLQVQ
jgi:tripartite-type tricarboxylate transporter receptor subunit TctC